MRAKGMPCTVKGEIVYPCFTTDPIDGLLDVSLTNGLLPMVHENMIAVTVLIGPY